jgi:hypothetical protein
MNKITVFTLKLINSFLFRLRRRNLYKHSLDYYINNLASIPRVSCKDKVVVTFTTTPERISIIDIMIKSIIDQTKLPDKIYLCIPEISRITQTTYLIPDWLKQIPILEIITTPTDLGPITKLIPTWLKEKHNENTKIIVVDDDQIYAKYLIETLVSWSELLPESALGNSGVLVPSSYLPSDIVCKPKTLLGKLRVSSAQITIPFRVDYLFGYAGVLLKAKFIDKNILDYSNAPSGSFFEDDLWLGGHLAKKNIERIIIPSIEKKLMPGVCKKTLHTLALCQTANESGKNMDTIYKFLFTKY